VKRFLIPIAIAASAVFLLLVLPEGAESLIPEHDCSFCHNIHGASGFGALLKNEVVETLCLTCHGPGGTSTLKADVHSNDSPTSYPAFSFTCTDCHDSHSNRTNWLGGTNIKLVHPKISTPNSGVLNAVFESRGDDAGEPTLHSFADNDQDQNGEYDGICEVCHTLTKHHRNNPDGGHKHHTGETCTRCHEHVDNFIP
jgi:predicted CXXCH cytochrome family protein